MYRQISQPASLHHAQKLDFLKKRDDDDSRDSGLVNYYYVFIAVFIVILLCALWGGNQHRRRRKTRHLGLRQSALAQDSDGWPNTRRWLHGNWRSEPYSVRARREEGLDANGEAPPPYMPAGTYGHNEPPPPAGNLDGTLAVPPPAVLRDSPFKPPEYQETVAESRPVEVTEQGSTRPTHPAAGPVTTLS